MASLAEVDGRKQDKDGDRINVCGDAQTNRSLQKVTIGSCGFRIRLVQVPNTLRCVVLILNIPTFTKNLLHSETYHVSQIGYTSLLNA